MPLAFLIIGIVLAVTAFRNTYRDVGTLIVGDLSGSNNFLVWIGAIAIVGAAGYVPQFRYPSRMFLALIILAMFLSNKGVFAQFAGALQGSNASQTPVTPEPSLPGALPVSLAVSGGGSSAGGIPGVSGATGDPASLASSVIPLIGAIL